MQSHAKLSSRPWARLRRRVLQKDGYRCSVCGGVRQLEVHHIIPRHIAPDKKYQIENLQVICRSDHEDMHTKQKIAPDAYAWRLYMKDGVKTNE